MIEYIYRNKRFFRSYSIVGLITAGIYFLLFMVTYKYLHLNHNLAVSISYFTAVLLHFTANRRVTFKAHGHALHVQLFKYVIMLGINYIITLLILYIVTSLTRSAYLGVICSISVTVVTGFLISKFWVFHHSTCNSGYPESITIKK